MPLEKPAVEYLNGLGATGHVIAAPATDRVGGRDTAPISACILLAGGLRQSPLVEAGGLSVLDFNVNAGQTLLEYWLERLRTIGPANGHATGVRVTHCDNTPAPAAPRTAPGLPLVISEDDQPYRGPAGIARDCIGTLGLDDVVLIAEAGRLPAAGIRGLAMDHAASGADVTVAANPDGSPAGAYLARCETLSIVPARGYMDLKEQWLGKVLEQGFKVRVTRLGEPGFLPLRARVQFLRAVGVLAGLSQHRPGFPTGLFRGSASDHRQRSVIAEGAQVDDGALIVDSVIMSGAVVEAGSVVARSIVCRGAVVRRGEERVDTVVSPAGVHSDAGPRGGRAKENGR